MFNYSRLIEGRILNDIAGAVYTNSSGSTKSLKVISFHNFGETSEEVTIWDGLNTDTEQWRVIPIKAKQTIDIEIPGPGMVKAAAGVLYAMCSTANTVNIRAWGGGK